MEKVISFTVSDMIESINDEINLELEDMKEETVVIVNNYTLTKVDKKLEGHFRFVYYLEQRDGIWYFNYVMGDPALRDILITDGNDITNVMSKGIFERIADGDITTTGKSLNDVVTIIYTIIPSLDSTVNEFFIVEKYEEEQIERAIHYMARIGIANFKTSDKLDKWNRLLGLYQVENQSELDKRLIKNKEWLKIQPFIFP